MHQKDTRIFTYFKFHQSQKPIKIKIFKISRKKNEKLFAFFSMSAILSNMLRLIRSLIAAPWCNGSTSDSGSFC